LADGPIVEVALHHRLSRISLDVEFGLVRETLAMVGPSGAGKSSVLRAIAGLLRPERGRISVHGRNWFDAATGENLAPNERSAGLVFQDLALFPHLTVRRNVEYGLVHRNGRRNESRHDRARRVSAVLDRFGLTALVGVKPGAISGGERQRVALARAVASEPDVLLLDEPLSALDPATRGGIATELAGHLRELALPTILVSHDFSDALGLADRIAVIERGAIVQAGTGPELLQAPATPFVAALTGVNYFRGTAARRGTLTEVHPQPPSSALFLSTDPGDGPVGVVVYPWEVALSSQPVVGSPRNVLSGPVVRVAGVGNRVRVTVGSSPVIVAEVTDEAMRQLALAPGVQVVATWKATGTRLVAERA
jgi:molybdate transport system ATP-binding protein